jgi:hypothetical protein
VEPFEASLERFVLANTKTDQFSFLRNSVFDHSDSSAALRTCSALAQTRPRIFLSIRVVHVLDITSKIDSLVCASTFIPDTLTDSINILLPLDNMSSPSSSNAASPASSSRSRASSTSHRDKRQKRETPAFL